MQARSVALVNLGCSKNLVDGENILGRLVAKGFSMVEYPASADVVIVNTCTFIKEATQEAVDVILESAKLKRDGTTLIVSGCFSQRYRDTVAHQFPEVNHWISVANWKQDLDAIFPDAVSAKGKQRCLTGPAASQYVKIAEGCSHRCSYCIIPAIRGDYSSRSIQSIVDEVLWLQKQGTQECILVAQDTSFFGKDRKESLTVLVETLLTKTSIPWFRLMYLHPSSIDDSLLRLMATEERVCSYLDIPLQHFADPILKAMKRFPLSDGIERLVDRIRTLVPQAAIRTAFIAGFPAETPAHFRSLLAFVERSRFEKVGVFPFSVEEGTVAAHLHPRPRSSTAQKRCEELMELQREVSRDIGERRIGTTVKVLVEAVSETGAYNFEGRTQWDAPEVDGRVFIEDGDSEPGAFVNVQIVDADAYDLFGRRIVGV